MSTKTTESKITITKQANAEFVVGIGASAGGLEALRPLIANLPQDSTMGYVIAQHLSPHQSTMLTEILARGSELAVVNAKNNMSVKANVIYVTPPNRDVYFKSGRLRLRRPHAQTGPIPSVDQFFTSLAEDLGDHAVGIILSGSGSDGFHGCRAIKAGGGIVIAQDPESAKYDSMPQAAIRAGAADLTLAPKAIAEKLESIVRTGPKELVKRDLTSSADGFAHIISRLMQECQVDFSHYKTSTLERQLERRMQTLQLEQIQDYIHYIDHHPKELYQLIDRFLISVTSFFRDSAFFKAIDETIQSIVDDKKYGDTIRFWVAGCATGEEAYSLAILLRERLSLDIKHFDVKIFATDLSLEATDYGRRGIYPETTVQDMDEMLLKKYFTRQGRGYKVNKMLREMLVFARQDMIQDPPFLNLDLISCRNVLIYFDSELQKKIFHIFHYALREGGVLFLGKSETIGRNTDLFATQDASHRIYRRKTAFSAAHIPLNLMPSNELRSISPKDSTPTLDIDSVKDTLLAAYSPTSILVDENHQCLHFFGEVQRFITLQGSTAKLDLLAIIKPALRYELRALLYRAKSSREVIQGHYQDLVLSPNDQRKVRFVIRPISLRNIQAEGLLVNFEEQAVTEDSTPITHIESISDEQAQQHVSDLEHELQSTKSHLQAVIEELETSNEELQSLNEELQASTEELQSSNEELQTANEELQATNEELSTVNQELQVKSDELIETNANLENIQNSIDLALIVVDNQLQITRYTPKAVKIFGILPNDIGHVVTALPTHLVLHDVGGKISQVIKEEIVHREEVTGENAVFLMQINPYRDDFGRTTGAVLTFTDITELSLANQALRTSEAHASAVLNTATDAIITIDEEAMIQSFNPAAERIFGYKADDVIGRNVNILMPEPYRSEHDHYMHRYLKIREAHIIGIGREMMAVRQNGQEFPIHLSVSEINVEGERYFTGMIRDITQRKQSEQALAAKIQELESFAAAIARDLKAPLRTLEGFSQILLKDSNHRFNDNEKAHLNKIALGAVRMNMLVGDLLEYSRLSCTPEEFVQVDLNEVIANIKKSMAQQIDNKQAIIEAAGLDTVTGHTATLELMVQHLIDNAMNYIDADVIPHITFTMRTETAHKVIVVEDNGIGIPEQFHQKIFDVLQRLHTWEDYPGTGIGLAIVQKAVQLHHGHIKLASAAGAGSTFEVWLPG